MPTYVCYLPRDRLSPDQKGQIADAIGFRHSEATGAPSYFVQVVIEETRADRYLGGERMSDHIWIRGDITEPTCSLVSCDGRLIGLYRGMKDTVVSVHDPQPAIADSYTFVLVHGGCHDGSMWQPVIERLEQLGHTAYGPTVAGHGKDVPKNVTHAESTQSIVDFILGRDLTDFILVGHGFAGTIISKVVEVIPERVRRLVFWSAFVLNDGETMLEMLPGGTEVFTQTAAESADNTFSIPFEVWRDVFINDGEPDLVQRSYAQLSSEPYGPWVEPLKMEKFHSLQIPRSFLVGAADMVMPPGDLGWHPRMSSRLGKFRLVQMPGSHEAIFTNPIGLADKFIEAGRD